MHTRKRVQPDGKKSLRTVIFFCTFVALLILGSILLKSISIWQNNTYQGGYSYVLQINGKNELSFVGFDPKGQKAAILTVTNIPGNQDVSDVVALPVDGSVDLDPLPKTHNAVASTLISSAFRMRSLKTNLTSFDFVRLSLAIRSVANGDVATDEVSFTDAKKGIDQIIGNAFHDSEILSEEMGVEIVNASNMSGVATELEKALTHLGVNILAVKTAPTSEKSSFIETGDKDSYTVKRLSKLLQYPVRITNSAELADIRIVLGEDVITTKKW